MTEVICFTDGAARGNPGPAGWGAVIATSEQVTEIGGAIENGTNNEAELQAVVAVLQQAEKEQWSDIVIYTDSKYLIKGATRWVHSWQNNGWTTQQDEPVKNQQLWKAIVSHQQQLSVTYKHVPGHAGVPANERADDIATAFADAASPELFQGSRDQYTVSLDPEPQLIEGGPVYLSLLDDEVRQHSSWEACKQRVEGRSASFRKVTTEPERDEVLSQWGKTLADVVVDS